MIEPYYQDDRVTLHNGDAMQVLTEIPVASIDSIVTDPPYGLSFMGKHWDYEVPSVDVWRECLRVLKPGGHLLAFAGTRTQHRMAVNIEDAGFEIRDMIAWVYGSGFPKSLDISKAIDKAAGAERAVLSQGKAVKRMIPGADQGKNGSWIKDNGREFTPTVTAPATEAAKQWEGWGTALKPALEPITVARKPIAGTVAANVLEHGTGGMNIEASRIDLNGDYKCCANGRPSQTGRGDHYDPAIANQPDNKGRFPANFIHDGSDEVVGLFPASKGQQGHVGPKHGDRTSVHTYGDWGPRPDTPPRGDQGSAARFFYCAKADSSERRGSKHPTIKPLDLMRYLVRLVTPVGATVLDPFAGSGTTIEAAVLEHCRAIGIERETEYCSDAAKRIEQGVLF